MKALILAAGYATRLYPLTKDYPKPLLKVGRRPIIDYIIDKLKPLDDIDEIANILLKNVSDTTSVSWVCEINSKEKDRLEVVVIAARGVLHEKR